MAKQDEKVANGEDESRMNKDQSNNGELSPTAASMAKREPRSARPSVSERLARFRKKDSLFDALISGSVTSGSGASNDRMLMERLLYRRFSQVEIEEIIGGYQNGDAAARQAMGEGYCRYLRRSVLRESTAADHVHR